VACDARDRRSGVAALAALVEHLLTATVPSSL